MVQCRLLRSVMGSSNRQIHVCAHIPQCHPGKVQSLHEAVKSTFISSVLIGNIVKGVAIDSGLAHPTLAGPAFVMYF